MDKENEAASRASMDDFVRRPECVCCRCDQPNASRRRMNTAYEDEELNWTTQCDECFELTQEEWQDMWDDYYRSRL
jgi:hypothetical protein